MCYAAGSQLAFAWFAAVGDNASFFPAAGITMAGLILFDRRFWPAVLAGAAVAEFAVDLAHGIALTATIGYVVANLTQPVVGAAALGQRRARLDISRLSDLWAYLLVAVLFGPLVGGVLGATNNVLVQDGDDWFRFAAEWWVGDGLGVLVVASTIVALWRSREAILRRSLWEPMVMTGVTAALTLIAFAVHWYALLYLPFVILFLIAVRSGTWAVGLAGAAVAFIAAEATARGNFLWNVLDVSDTTGLLYLQLSLGVVIGGALIVAAGVSEREDSTAAYAISEASRREADLARLRAELLWELAEELAQASTPDEIAIALSARQLLNAWPKGVPVPPATHAVRDLSDALEQTPNEVTSHRSVQDSAVRMTRDALQRVRLVGEERRARERAELLEHHANNLAAAGSPHEVAAVTVGDVASLGAAYTAVWIERGEAMVVLASDQAPGDDDTPTSLSRDLDLPVTECARTGQVLVYPTREALLERYPAMTNQLARSSETVVTVPLKALNGTVLGALVVADRAPNWLTPTRRQLILGLAGQCGLALDRAQLQANAMQAAVDADQLARIGELLDQLTTVRDRAQYVADELVRLGATCVEIDLAGGRRAEAFTDDSTQGGDLLILPLQARGQLVGQIRVGGHELLVRRAQLVRDIATRAAIALDNAQLYEGEREASHRLQLGLLDFSTPEVEDCRIDVAYRPGTATLEVGGDWHDAFRLPNGSLGLVVGDVVGHGLDAAAAMAQLRGAVRGLAAVSSPAELLARLDAFVDSLPAAFMTTLVYVELDPRTGVMRYACAGHPPPLIVSATGVSRLLWDARSAPLGLESTANRVESVDRLEDGERLVLYTDGLVERRREEIDAGLARLVHRSQHDVATPDFVDRLCNDMEIDGTGDDICVLAVTLMRPRSFATFCASRPEELAVLRKQLRSWLSSLGCADDVSGDIVLAASEAAANSIEHGAAPDGRGIAVVGRADDGTISLVIRDHGIWKEPGRSSNRGRGLPIMRELMDTVSVEPVEDGTLVRMEVAVPSH